MMTHRNFPFGGRIAVSLAVAALGGAVAACTADVARIEQPSLGLADGADAPKPRPPDAMRSDLGAADGMTLARAEPAEQGDASPERAAPPAPAALAAGEKTIEIKKGDTLFGLAKRHRVGVAALKARNDIDGHALKPGQKLVLPPGAKDAAKPQKSKTEAAARKLPPAPEGWTHTYRMKSGDVLSSVARRHGVKTAELQRVNGITDPRRLRAGAVLRVPALAGAAEAKPLTRTANAETAPRREPAARPVILNDAGAAAASPDRTDEDEPADAATPESGAAPRTAMAPVERTPETGRADGEDKLRWPVKGRIVSAFGPRADGTQNDGLNIAVPMGTEVHAAERGVVAYAGDELAGYGNLVLVRHENGWVTAYANNSEVTVKRGDSVKRGQVIAKAGNSGGVGQPQLHFELRQSSKPVDPTPFLEEM